MSIKVKNTSPKVIGLGGQHVVQGQSIILPDGFGLEHPTVKFLVNRGWLTVITAGGVVLPPGVKATGEGNPPAENTGTGEGTPPANPADSGGNKTDEDDPANNGATGDGEPADNSGDIAENPTRSQIRRMNSEQLRNLATKRGIPFESNTTNAALIDLILAALTDADNGGQE